MLAFLTITALELAGAVPVYRLSRAGGQTRKRAFVDALLWPVVLWNLAAAEAEEAKGSTDGW